MPQTGRIIKAISGFYEVDAGEEQIICKARGVFRKKGAPPLVGDRVEFIRSGDGGVIETVLPRKNSLIRPPLANLDRLYLVSAYRSPAPNTLQLDKMAAIAEKKDIEPVMVFNKSDLGSFDRIASDYRRAGFRVFVVSCETGEGIDALRADLRGVCAFSGNSGVGKSSLLNRLEPSLALKTGEVSDRLGRGRHTTRHAELFRLSGGAYLADTPGFSTLETQQYELMFKDEIAACFRDFAPFLGRCRFVSCSHTREKGCAVVAAVERGEIVRSRHESYCEMYREAQSLKEWEHRAPDEK